jgi:hypothetical protein
MSTKPAGKEGVKQRLLIRGTVVVRVHVGGVV